MYRFGLFVCPVNNLRFRPSADWKLSRISVHGVIKVPRPVRGDLEGLGTVTGIHKSRVLFAACEVKLSGALMYQLLFALTFHARGSWIIVACKGSTGIIGFCDYLILWHIGFCDCFTYSHCLILAVQPYLILWHIGFCDCLVLLPGESQNPIMPALLCIWLRMVVIYSEHLLHAAVSQFFELFHHSFSPKTLYLSPKTLQGGIAP